ncbi:methylated-DNA--[protein]-cysteine S-methyltransferase [Maledivibacter halophilus]|uniref:methylated-DNA--[protein]-cysteine S-methyltransferase n=1 Tax=Maledivibacter halophilus TaxID=36842 RepID=A0A1T5MCB1_9FIRM|nr:methylated-DNA--[protein]-cysteine S-methyltransferase [Maledivibacter halophilus]SKC85519.1 methylated-DNA-[protein]-cysteine S-methyltransferase [Maledivibacter halophilus]
MKKYKDKNVYYYIYNTLFGKIFFASADDGLCNVSFMDNDVDKHFNWLKKHFAEDNIMEDNKKNRIAFNQIQEYLSGSRKTFNLQLHFLGTPFQISVWEILYEIGYGDIWTYKDVSKKLGDMKKCRAVGGAIGKNPIGIIVPCHRVIGSNGKLTGFSAPGGISLKKKLLDLEKKHCL